MLRACQGHEALYPEDSKLLCRQLSCTPANSTPDGPSPGLENRVPVARVATSLAPVIRARRTHILEEWDQRTSTRKPLEERGRVSAEEGVRSRSGGYLSLRSRAWEPEPRKPGALGPACEKRGRRSDAGALQLERSSRGRKARHSHQMVEIQDRESRRKEREKGFQRGASEPGAGLEKLARGRGSETSSAAGAAGGSRSAHPRPRALQPDSVLPPRPRCVGRDHVLKGVGVLLQAVG